MLQTSQEALIRAECRLRVYSECRNCPQPRPPPCGRSQCRIFLSPECKHTWAAEQLQEANTTASTEAEEENKTQQGSQPPSSGSHGSGTVLASKMKSKAWDRMPSTLAHLQEAKAQRISGIAELKCSVSRRAPDPSGNLNPF